MRRVYGRDADLLHLYTYLKASMGMYTILIYHLSLAVKTSGCMLEVTMEHESEKQFGRCCIPGTCPSFVHVIY